MNIERGYKKMEREYCIKCVRPAGFLRKQKYIFMETWANSMSSARKTVARACEEMKGTWIIKQIYIDYRKR